MEKLHRLDCLMPSHFLVPKKFQFPKKVSVLPDKFSAKKRVSFRSRCSGPRPSEAEIDAGLIKNLKPGFETKLNLDFEVHRMKMLRIIESGGSRPGKGSLVQSSERNLKCRD